MFNFEHNLSFHELPLLTDASFKIPKINKSNSSLLRKKTSFCNHWKAGSSFVLSETLLSWPKGFLMSLPPLLNMACRTSLTALIGPLQHEAVL